MLPIIETPRFTLTVPSSGKKVSYRPYLVKEEKILFIALESGDGKAIVEAMQDVVKACTFGELDIASLTTFDLEYVFLQLRIKSVGESVSVNLKCEFDGEFTPVDINLSEVKLIQDDSYTPERDIKVTDSIGMVLKPITLKRLSEMNLKDEANIMESLTNRIAGCIDHIYDREKIYKASSVPMEELVKFVDSLSHSHLQAIQEYIASFPRVEHTVKFNCFKCGKENTVKLQGIQSFFG